MALDETISAGQPAHLTDHQTLHVEHNRTLPCGEYFFSTAVETVISVAGTPVKALGTTTEVTDPPVIELTHANNRLTYTGTETRAFIVSAHLTMSVASGNVIVELSLAKGGVAAEKTIVHRKVGTAGDEGAAGIHGLFTLATNEYMEVFIANDTSTGNATIEHGNLVIVAID